MSKQEMQNRKEATYRKILDTSWDIAINEGMDALAIRKVATALHFAPNNLYNYFKDKSDLIYHLKKDAYEWTFAVVLSDIPTCPTVKELMETVFTRLMHTALKEPRRFIIMTSDLIMDAEEPLDIEINKYVADIIRQGIQQGEFREVDPYMTATNLRAALISFVRWICAQGELSKEQAEYYLDNFNLIIFQGIKCENKIRKDTK